MPTLWLGLLVTASPRSLEVLDCSGEHGNPPLSLVNSCPLCVLGYRRLSLCFPLPDNKAGIRHSSVRFSDGGDEGALFLGYGTFLTLD